MKKTKFLTILVAIFAQRFMADWMVFIVLSALIIALYTELIGDCILNIVRRARLHKKDEAVSNEINRD